MERKDLKGAHELLLLTRPKPSNASTRNISAGADVLETNTFSATTIGLHEFLFDETPRADAKTRVFERSFTIRSYVRSHTK
jgi:methionine synthase I (cobalamin-dependent)